MPNNEINYIGYPCNPNNNPLRTVHMLDMSKLN